MAHGGNYVGLDKGWSVLSTYNTSSTDGVEEFRAVIAASDTIDLQTSAGDAITGVVQEKIDAEKVATGNAVANVRMGGITKMYVGGTPGALAQMAKVAVDANGEAVAAGSGDVPIGVQLTDGTPSAGDLIDVLLTPGMPDLA